VVISVGIDMTQSVKPCSLVVLKNKEVGEVKDIADDKEIVKFTFSEHPKVVAIDSPLFLPNGLCCLESESVCKCTPISSAKGRICERLLSKRGISSYYTTKKTFIKRMIYRSIELKRQFERQGLEVIEIYPYASWMTLFGKLPKKTTPEGLSARKDKLQTVLTNMALVRTHDQADAAIAAYTGYLYAIREAQGVGDVSEGFLWIPTKKGT